MSSSSVEMRPDVEADDARLVLMTWLAERDAAPAVRRAAIESAINTWKRSRETAEKLELADASNDMLLAYGLLHWRARYASMPHPNEDVLQGLGARLLALHTGAARPKAPMRIDLVETEPDPRPPRLMLRAQREYGLLRVDAATMLVGVPPTAWACQSHGEPLLSIRLQQLKTMPIAIDKDEAVRYLQLIVGLSAVTAQLVDAASASAGVGEAVS